MNRIFSFFSASGDKQNIALGMVRIITGCFLIYHGWEVFDGSKIAEYASWDMFKNLSFGKSLVILGKGSELIGGLMFFLGVFTRLASLLVAATMFFITFYIGHGKIWYDDQYPFLFLLLCVIFFFVGAGNFAIDNFLAQKFQSNEN